MADSLSSLPIDNTIPHQQELKTVNELFRNHGNTIDSVIGEFKTPITYGIIFLILSLPITTKGINCLVPSVNNKIFTILIKTLIFILLVYVYINYSKF